MPSIFGTCAHAARPAEPVTLNTRYSGRTGVVHLEPKHPTTRRKGSWLYELKLCVAFIHARSAGTRVRSPFVAFVSAPGVIRRRKPRTVASRACNKHGPRSPRNLCVCID